MSHQPTPRELQDRTEQLPAAHADPDDPASVSVPYEDLKVVLEYATANSDFTLNGPDDPITDAVDSLIDAATTHTDSPFQVTRQGHTRLLVTYNGHLIGGFSTDYHADGEALLYNPTREEPVANTRGYADTVQGPDGNEWTVTDTHREADELTITGPDGDVRSITQLDLGDPDTDWTTSTRHITDIEDDTPPTSN